VRVCVNIIYIICILYIRTPRVIGGTEIYIYIYYIFIYIRTPRVIGGTEKRMLIMNNIICTMYIIYHMYNVHCMYKNT
jgi:hypothetical protein